MRELVYLSDRKLQQFLPERRRRMPRAKWQFSTPVGGMGWEPGAADAERARLERLQQVVRHVSSSARWFAEPELQAGSWVQFEAPLNYRTLRRAAPGMVLFVDVPHSVEGYETGGEIRLLLHGSARHMAGGQDPLEVEPPSLSETETRGGGGFGSSAAGGYVEFVTRATQAAHLLDSLRAEPPATSDDPRQLDGSVPLAEGTRQLLQALDGQLPMETAAWMCGFARLTAVIAAPWHSRSKRYVVGTPLYVEFAAE